MLSNNADEYGGQTVPEKVAEQLHNENTVIVKLTPTSVAPERQKLNVYTSEITQAILIRLSSVAYHAIMQDERRNQIISVTFGNGAFFCQVKESIAAKLLPPSITFEKKMRVEAADMTLITLISASSIVQCPMNAAFTILDGLSNSDASDKSTVRPVAGEDAIPTIASMTFEVNTVSMSGGKM